MALSGPRADGPSAASPPSAPRSRADGGGDDAETEWAALRRPYWSERVALWGRPEDHVGLVHVLLEENLRGVEGSLESADRVLRNGLERHPRAVPIWELVVLVSSMTGRGDEFDQALATIERLDPTSRVLSALREVTPERTSEYVEALNETQQRLHQALGSFDSQVREAAVAELAQWARSYPTNSTHVINHAFGLRAVGREAEAQRLALAATQIEDGSFADAYNIGVILIRGEHRSEGLAMLRQAVTRAGSAEERADAEQAIAGAAP
jgi:hypothetical protein